MILTERDGGIPDDDPGYTLHRIIIQMIMDGVQLQDDVDTRER